MKENEIDNEEQLTLYNVFDEDGNTEINSLSQYIQLIEMFSHNKGQAKDVYSGEVNITDDYSKIEHLINPTYIFRGETHDFDKTATTSGAFRGKNKHSIYPDFRIAKGDYYRTIGHRLTEIERENFTAFSQHHGLITNLLDVTDAPLTALFMACDKQDDTPGYVYIFEDYLDVTEILEEYPEKNIIELLVSNDKSTVKKFFNAIFLQNRQYQFRNGGMLNCMKVLIQNICNMTESMNDIHNELAVIFDEVHQKAKIIANSRQPLTFRSIGKLFELSQSINNHEHGFELSIKYPDDYYNKQLIYIYLTLLIFYLKYSWKQDNGEYMPYMIYRPRLAFERARLQQGFFIIQPFKSFDENDNRIRLIQKVVHSKAIKVNNPKLILKQLDSIGINKGTMYGDYDNIARYIRDKHSNA